ncbi:MAG: type I DNA topoisomerase [Candidatus Eisenbacteria bacterium]|nr:type I DNA topoisomerase [Candidatus Eisenbacteria bacterium]
MRKQTLTIIPPLAHKGAVSKPLVIVESPAKARTISKFLGSSYVVESSIGHVRDLPSSATEIPKIHKDEPWARLSVDVDNGFRPIYIVPARKREQIRKLKAALKSAPILYLATDEDREGESIAWHLLEVLAPSSKVQVKRMVFHEITKRAIEEALAKPREIDQKLVDAQEARRIYDRLFGYEVSPVLWKKVAPKLSAGRVQSVATRLVVDREKQRMAFRTAEYWDLSGRFGAKGSDWSASIASLDGLPIASGKDFDPATGKLTDPNKARLLLQADAEGLTKRLDGASWQVASVTTKDYEDRPYPPFITSTVQQEAGRKFRFTAARTMSVAQALYERGYITYMRTDSTELSGQAISAARAAIKSLYGEEYLPSQPRAYHKKVKNAQEAHEAIRPAGETFRLPDDVRGELDSDEWKLYDLIWKRTMACQMENARGKKVSLRLAATSSSGEKVEFGASGKTIEFPGFLRAYVEGSDDPDAQLEDREVRLPALKEGDPVTCHELKADGHSTQPPARYTEVSLIKELEARGIGRPSTFASIIETIQRRNYVWKKGQALVPTWTAFAVVQLLTEYFSEYVDYEFTASMEEDLDSIARGEKERNQWLSSKYFGNGSAGLHQMVAEHLPSIDARKVNSIPLGKADDGDEVILRVGRFGPFVNKADKSASVPEDIPPDELTIAVALNLIERQNEPDRVVGLDPETSQPIYAKDGRYGPYVQLGDLPPPSKGRGKAKTKPKTASLFKSMSLNTLSLEDALKLLSQPRTVGIDPEKGEPIQAQNGRFGPYLKRGTDTRSLPDEASIFGITLEQALALFAQPKRGRARGQAEVLHEVGTDPKTGLQIRVLKGKYGPYISNGTLNATVPRGQEPKELDLERALELLRARAAQAPEATTKRTVKKRAPSARKRA